MLTPTTPIARHYFESSLPELKIVIKREKSKQVELICA